MAIRFLKLNTALISWAVFGQILLVLLLCNETLGEFAYQLKDMVGRILPGANLIGLEKSSQEAILSRLLPLMWIFSPALLLLFMLFSPKDIYPEEKADRLPVAVAVLAIACLVIVSLPVKPTRMTIIFFYSNYTAGLLFSCLTAMPPYFIRLITMLPVFNRKI